MEGYGRTWFTGGDAYFDPEICCGAPTKETISFINLLTLAGKLVLYHAFKYIQIYKFVREAK